MKLKLLLPALALGLCTTLPATCAESPAPNAYQIPATMQGVRQPQMSLNGAWQFQYSPSSRWTTIQVPGEAAMQGYAIEHDKPVLYRKTFTLPADYAGKQTMLRFDGVYSYARLTVNGHSVREHHGGFSRWETDITPYVRPGKKNTIEVKVTDRLDEISYASGYAHHPIGGILRDVTLFALPTDHLYNIAVQTPLDSAYRDATLRFICDVAGDSPAEIGFTLASPDGTPVHLGKSNFPLPTGSGSHTWEFQVADPAKWDAEHPNLYTLTVTLRQDGNEISRYTRKIGFRQIEIKGDRMLVNGRPVKLRGACRHDIHPTLGRTTTPELDSLDVMLFKESNMNFVRTSHYPPSEKFLEYCDRYGLYVECESAVCFVDTHRQKNYAPAKTQDDPVYADRYLDQCQEMVRSFLSHPSILFWSIGNESVYGANFRQCWDWVKANDPTRPVIFSYPGTVSKDEKAYDLLSMHYQDVNGNLWQYGMSTRGFQGHGIPAIFDEWAHPACYTYATLQHDPNIREFWGQSLDMMWSGLFSAPGGLGGAIWGYIDETFALPEPTVGTAWWKEFAHTAKPEAYQGNCVGYGEWGIVDVWRRHKPEFWATKKAHSPVRLTADRVIPDFTSGNPLALPVWNRFDHTDLQEVRGSYTYKGVKKEFTLPSIAPHDKGILTIPAEPWADGEPLVVEFRTADGSLIDSSRLTFGAERIEWPSKLPGGTLTVEESDTAVIVRGNGFTVPFDKRTGLICDARAGDRVLIERGPFLNLYINLNHLTGAEVRRAANYYATSEAEWKKNGFACRLQPDGVYVDLSGTYGTAAVEFRIKISPDGELAVDYQTSGVPNGYLRETGVAFHLADAISELEWDRKGYWDCYPADAFAGNQGQTPLYQSRQAAYGVQPVQPWQDDTHEYYYWADAGTDSSKPLTRKAKGMKENIRWYTLSATPEVGHSLSVVSPDASLACRLNKTAAGQLVLYVNNHWDYPEIAWGNYCKTLEALPCLGRMKMTLK